MTDAELERGRTAFGRRAWSEARRALSDADAREPLGPRDLELLATAAYMMGDDPDFERALERAHHAYLEVDELPRAVRSAAWVGISLALRGERGPASGWFGRAQRLVEAAGDCVEQGYLLLPTIMRHEATGEYEAAAAVAADAIEIAQRFGEADLLALALHSRGRVLIAQGRNDEGLPLLDEAMVAVTAGELSPIVTGIVYCSVIEGCQKVYEIQRAQEWTMALTRWCDEQSDLVSFTGKCLLHRSEIMIFHGAWLDALDEARRAGARFVADENTSAAGHAAYYEGEVHRLRGEHDAAEQAYTSAARSGWEPQPGLALLRLAQGDGAAALAAIRRVIGETTDPARRAGLLPAAVEIVLAAGDIDGAREVSVGLARAEGEETELLRAMRLHAEGAVDLAAGDEWAALTRLRRAADLYDRLDVRYELARVRELVSDACRALGDDDTATLELDAARDAFAALGASVDLARVESRASGVEVDETHGLTPRELEVLRLIAAGKSNRAIATELVISERTVARHVSNIFAKLRLGSRSAATAYAYEHALL